jgi:hypothetical protein
MELIPLPGLHFPGTYTRPRAEEHRPLAMAYVMPQPQISNTYPAAEAVRKGTLFPELDKPFTGRRPAYDTRDTSGRRGDRYYG